MASSILLCWTIRGKYAWKFDILYFVSLFRGRYFERKIRQLCNESWIDFFLWAINLSNEKVTRFGVISSLLCEFTVTGNKTPSI